DAPANQDLEKNFETLRVQMNAFNALPAHHKEPGHWVFYSDAGALQGISHPRCHCGNGAARGIPAGGGVAAAIHVTAADRDVVSLAHGRKEEWQELGWMLQVSINHAQNFSAGIFPAVDDGAGEPSLVDPHQQLHPRIAVGEFSDNALRAVGTVVVHHK